MLLKTKTLIKRSSSALPSKFLYSVLLFFGLSQHAATLIPVSANHKVAVDVVASATGEAIPFQFLNVPVNSTSLLSVSSRRVSLLKKICHHREVA
ncbi:hypothetical protein V2J09_015856 [Rumex salicifolius]